MRGSKCVYLPTFQYVYMHRHWCFSVIISLFGIVFSGSVEEFISAWKNENHPKHRVITRTIAEGRGFTWAAHFLPQSHWLRDAPITAATRASLSPRLPPSSVDVSFSLQQQQQQQQHQQGWSFSGALSSWLRGASSLDPRPAPAPVTGSARKNIIIIRHTTKRNLFAKRVMAAFTHALREVNIAKSDSDHEKEREMSAIPNINISKKLKNDTNTAAFISEENLKWLKEQFKLDFELVESARTQYHAGKGPWKAVY